jgi:magnesium-translocating P-type ATPase
MSVFPRSMHSAPARQPQGGKLEKEEQRRLLELCSVGVQATLSLVESRKEGLSGREAEERLRIYGPNVLASERRRGAFAEILIRLKDPLVIQLLVICAVSFAMGDLRAGTVVACMIFISVFLGYFQERRSGDAAEKLKLMVQASAVVLRDGAAAERPISDVVPGDIVVLAAGSIVPADMRIIEAKDFFVTQAALTGESMPVEKSATLAAAEGASPAEASVFDLGDACFQGSTVVSGSGRGVAINTGMRTFLGGVAADLAGGKGATDFDRGMASFVKLMVRFMLVMVSITFLAVGITKGNWVEALLFGLSVAVGLTPEMLPMIATVCLSKGAVYMSRKKVIVKKLKAIQNLGAMDVLCTDKTGTITQDRVVLERHVDVTSRPSEDVLRYAWMNSYYQTGLRNLLDESILSNEDLDVERSLRKVDEIPFDFVRKRMSVIVAYEGSHVLICKGSVEAIFEACDRYQIDEEVLPLIDVVKQDILEEYASLSSQGYRVLAIAYREFETSKESFSSKDESTLILLGYIAFFDPPKDSAQRAVESLARHGVRAKVLTGDNELVTAKVCRDVGFREPKAIMGRELESLDEATFAAAVQEHDVFARLTPAQKERIVLALRKGGHVVGFMGDGINDAAAMRAADVGISVDSAVDVAKESADIILLEKNLLVLEDGIIEGRRLFANIVKYIKMSASSNFGNMFSVVGSAFLLPFLPMAPIQILLNNLLYDISQTGIPLDNVDPEIVQRPQKWEVGLIRRFMVSLGPVSSLFDYATFGLMLFVLGCSAWWAPGASAEAKAHLERLFHTGWFVESLLTQTLIVHIIRTNRIPFFQSRASLAMSVTTFLVMAAGVLLPYSPLAPFFGLEPLPAAYWAWIAGFLLCYSILAHLIKTAFARRHEPRGAEEVSR